MTFAIADTLIAALSIITFGWGAWFFGRWWILLFTVIPLVSFMSHTVIADIVEDGGENDS